MIKIAEILRLNKPIAVEINWNASYDDEIFQVSKILLKGKQIFINEDEQSVYHKSPDILVLNSDDNRYETLKRHLEDEGVKFEADHPFLYRFDISSDYFQILNPR